MVLFYRLFHLFVELCLFVQLVKVRIEIIQVNQRFFTVKVLDFFVSWRNVTGEILPLKQLNIKAFKLTAFSINRQLSQNDCLVVVFLMQKELLTLLTQRRQCSDVFINPLTSFDILFTNFLMILYLLICTYLALDIADNVWMYIVIFEITLRNHFD